LNSVDMGSLCCPETCKTVILHAIESGYWGKHGRPNNQTIFNVNYVLTIDFGPLLRALDVSI